MKYKGEHNDNCPLCKSSTIGGHPVMYRYSGVPVFGHLWCASCYDQYIVAQSRLTSESKIHLFIHQLEFDLVGCRPKKIPIDAQLAGFRFGPFTNHDKLGLVLDFT
jgi:hypothetical protein